MNVYAFLALCFIPLVATTLLLTMLVGGLRLRYSLWACVVALIAVLPIAFVQFFVGRLPVFADNTFSSLLLTAMLFNGAIEESLKALFMLLLPRKKLPLAAFFSCALLFGLTLGSFETVIYLVRLLQTAALPTGIDAAFRLMVLRMATAVLVHTFCAGLSGLGIWQAAHGKLRPTPFLYTVLLHGFHNFFAAFNTNFRYFSIVAILFAALECRIWYRQAQPEAQAEA